MKNTIIFNLLLSFLFSYSNASFFDYFYACHYSESCQCGISDPWVRNPQNSWIDAMHLEAKLKERLYGQPLIISELSNAIADHINKKDPSKALSIALHGLPGTGKSYTAKIVADFIYRRGMDSEYAHIFLGGIRNCENINECLRNHQYVIRSTILKTLQLCKRALFVIDEVDDMPSVVLDSLVPFLDEQGDVFGVDPRQSIFMFLSNSGTTEIAKKTLEYHKMGIKREDMDLNEMEQITRKHAFAEDVKEGKNGFKNSKLIQRNLIQYHLPYLPLERKHVIECIKYYIRQREQNVSPANILKAAKKLEYIPENDPVFSAYGCRPVEKIVGQLLRQNKQKKNEL